MHKHINDAKKLENPLDFRGALHYLAGLRVPGSALTNSAHSAHGHESWSSIPGDASRKVQQHAPWRSHTMAHNEVQADGSLEMGPT